MSFPRICRFLSYLSFLLGGAMLIALPWTFPLKLQQTFPFFRLAPPFDSRSFFALTGSVLVCAAIGVILRFLGRNSVQIDVDSEIENEADRPYNPDELYVRHERDSDSASNRLPRRESIAIVGLSWILAGILCSFPFLFSGIIRDDSDSDNPIHMSVVDCLFESFSGVTGFGATVIKDVENPVCIPKAIQFWRCELHFLGGLGIMALFVAVLGGRSTGKSLMLTEMPRSSSDSPYAQVRNTAIALLGVYLFLNLALNNLLLLEGMSFYDAVCHSFSCIATGGFSSRNASIASFNNIWIEQTIVVFMFISSCSFTLLYYAGRIENKNNDITASGDKERPKYEFGISKLLTNTEFQIFVCVVVIATILVSGSCWLHGDFLPEGQKNNLSWSSLCDSFRYGGFQVMTIISSTGFGLENFDVWNDFSRGILFVLIFTGGCVGSTTCGLKLMRLIVLWKTLRIEVERVFRPNVVRVIHLQGKPVDDSDELRRSVLTYFAMYAMVFVTACILLTAIEPSTTWTGQTSAGKTLDPNDQMFDCITAVATTLNCVGPSFGITGVTENFGVFHAPAKILFIILMLMGRLEIYILLVFLHPKFWKG